MKSFSVKNIAGVVSGVVAALGVASLIMNTPTLSPAWAAKDYSNNNVPLAANVAENSPPSDQADDTANRLAVLSNPAPTNQGDAANSGDAAQDTIKQPKTLMSRDPASTTIIKGAVKGIGIGMFTALALGLTWQILPYTLLVTGIGMELGIRDALVTLRTEEHCRNQGC